MKVDIFDFHLPEKNIALHPVSPRENGRLLHIAPPAGLADYHIRDLPLLLQAGDALVFNDTKVIHAQLQGQRYRHSAAKRQNEINKADNAVDADDVSIARIGVTLHMRIADNMWRAFIRPARRLRVGEEIIFSKDSERDNAAGGGAAAEEKADCLKAAVAEKGEAGEMLLRFNKSGADLDAAIGIFGHMPLPPYIAMRRGAEPQDERDYQTIYAREKGAVAAPTAGLHFTPSLLAALRARGVEQYFVTLHVGAGTFLPVKADDTKDHKMHAEIGSIDARTAENLQKVKARGGKIIAVGTTALRVLETAALPNGHLQAWSGSTDIFITPGYRFRFVDRLMTNFHLPRSTLFMLVSAFSGLNLMKKAYAHAVDKNYRFYSYGDSCLLDLADSV